MYAKRKTVNASLLLSRVETILKFSIKFKYKSQEYTYSEHTSGGEKKTIIKLLQKKARWKIESKAEQRNKHNRISKGTNHVQAGCGSLALVEKQKGENILYFWFL